MGRPRIPKRSYGDMPHKRCCVQAHNWKCPCGSPHDDRPDADRYMLFPDCFSPDRGKVDGYSAKCKRCNNSSSIISQALRFNKELDETERIIAEVRKDQMKRQTTARDGSPHPREEAPTPKSDASSDPYDFLTGGSE
jgi:hypothetical protein